MDFLFFLVKGAVVVWFVLMLAFIHSSHNWSKNVKVKHDDVARAIQSSAKFAFPLGLLAVFVLTVYQVSNL